MVGGSLRKAVVHVDNIDGVRNEAVVIHLPMLVIMSY